MQPEHKLRRQDRAMSREESWQFLSGAKVGRLALATPQGHPYIVPLNYVVLNKEIYFHCAKEGHKLDILRKNSRVCFEADALLGIKASAKACEFSTYYKSVLAFGQAYEVMDAAKKAEVLNALTAKYAPVDHNYEPVTAEEGAHVSIIGISIDVLTGKASIKDE